MQGGSGQQLLWARTSPAGRSGEDGSSRGSRAYGFLHEVLRSSERVCKCPCRRHTDSFAMAECGHEHPALSDSSRLTEMGRHSSSDLARKLFMAQREGLGHLSVLLTSEIILVTP